MCLGRGFGLHGKIPPRFIKVFFYLFGYYFWSLMLEFIRVTSITLVDIVICERGRVVICCIQYSEVNLFVERLGANVLFYLFFFLYILM